MNSFQKKVSSQQRTDEQQLASAQQQTQQSAGHEFATPEEMIRHDARNTPVPPAIGHRLQDAINQLPPPRRSWWRRLLGG